MSTWIITGANRGLGLELARQIAARGETVIATTRSPDEASELTALGVRVLPLDVTSDDSVRAFTRSLGDIPIDKLFNNAGIYEYTRGIDELDIGSLSRHFEVNSVGQMRVTQALLPALRRGRDKQLINMSTLLGSIASNERGGLYGYRASKAALNMLNKTLALELGPQGFICVVMQPGWVRTDLGGPQATLSVGESVTGMLAVIDRLAPADNGRFRTYDGQELPW